MDNYDNYDNLAREFLDQTGTKMSVRLLEVVEGFPNSDDKNLHDKYYIILNRDGKKYGFCFYGSAADHDRGNKVGPYDVLAALQKYEVEKDVWDFAKEYGYEINSKESYERVRKIREACEDEYRNVVRLFEDCMERLREIV